MGAWRATLRSPWPGIRHSALARALCQRASDRARFSMEIIMQLGERDIGPNGTTLERQQGRSASAVAAEKKKTKKLVYFLGSLRKNDAVRDSGPGGFVTKTARSLHFGNFRRREPACRAPVLSSTWELRERAFRSSPSLRSRSLSWILTIVTSLRDVRDASPRPLSISPRRISSPWPIPIAVTSLASVSISRLCC